MKQINHVPKVLWFAVMFLFISVAAYAQDTSSVQSPSVTSPSAPSTYPSTSPSTTPSTTETSQSNQSPRSQDLSFNSQAAKLANELVNQTGLSSDKAPDIVEILKDYRNNLADARAKYLEKHPDAKIDEDATGSSSSSTVNINMGGILGTNVDKYYVGANPDLMSDYKDADKSADKKIKKVFDNDVQTSRYEQNKGQWWSDVKDQVFSSLKQSPQSQDNMQKQDNMQNQDNDTK